MARPKETRRAAFRRGTAAALAALEAGAADLAIMATVEPDRGRHLPSHRDTDHAPAPRRDTGASKKETPGSRVVGPMRFGGTEYTDPADTTLTTVAARTQAPSAETEERTSPPAQTRRQPAAVSKRQHRSYRARSTVFRATPPDVAGLLDGLALSTDRVYLAGARPGGNTAEKVREWALGPLPAGWGHGSHYLGGSAVVLRYQRPDGRSVEVAEASQWFGAGDYTADDAGAAWAMLGGIIGRLFRDGVLMSTPATTGRTLWSGSIPWGTEWPVLPIEIQTEIRDNFGQGRIEILTEPGRTELPALVGYDGRLMYAALSWGLAAGAHRVTEGVEHDDYRRGFYEMAVTVPAGWEGPGLLPARGDDGGWCWPAEPGRTFTSWADGSEVMIARRHGWAMVPGRAITFAPPERGKGPLDSWAEKIAAARSVLLEHAKRGEPAGPVMLAAAGLRSILLHGIGAFHGRPHRVTRSTTDRDVAAVEAGADLHREGESYVWTDDTGQAWPDMAHPEWSAAIWGRARARLLDAPTRTPGHRVGMLHVARSTLIACRTDAIYLDHDPRWSAHDDGIPGRFRRQTNVAGPMPAPHTHTELLTLREGT